VTVQCMCLAGLISRFNLIRQVSPQLIFTVINTDSCLQLRQSDRMVHRLSVTAQLGSTDPDPQLRRARRPSTCVTYSHIVL